MIIINTGLEDRQVKQLKKIHEIHGMVRADLIRRAIDKYIKENYPDLDDHLTDSDQPTERNKE